MRVLITGASGLVGGRLIRFLLETGGVRIRAASRQPRSWPAGVEGMVADIGRPHSLPAACDGVDAVINLSTISERLSAADPMEALRVNAGGAFALAAAARDAGVARFVQVSTNKVYGNSPAGRVTEETVCRPRSHYAITHRAAEDYAQALHPDCVVFRLANGFGAPVEPSQGVVWEILTNELCRDAVVRGAIAIKSSGLTWRNFVPMPDIVRALHAAATGRLPAGTYNLGAAQSMTLRDLAERVARVSRDVLGIQPALTFGEVQPGERHEPLDYRVDKITAAGLAPAAPVDDELREVLLVAQGAFAPEPR